MLYLNPQQVTHGTTFSRLFPMRQVCARDTPSCYSEQTFRRYGTSLCHSLSRWSVSLIIYDTPRSHFWMNCGGVNYREKYLYTTTTLLLWLSMLPLNIGANNP